VPKRSKFLYINGLFNPENLHNSNDLNYPLIIALLKPKFVTVTVIAIMVKTRLLNFVVTRIVVKDFFNVKMLELQRTNITIVLNQQI